MDEKRKFLRVSFNIQAQIDWKGKKLAGEVANLSLRGMLAKLSEPIPTGETVATTLQLTGTSSDLKICLTGKVVRSAPEGTGIEFQQMDLDSFTYLRNIVAYNSGDADRIDEEFMAYVKQRGASPA